MLQSKLLCCSFSVQAAVFHPLTTSPDWFTTGGPVFKLDFDQSAWMFLLRGSALSSPSLRCGFQHPVHAFIVSYSLKACLSPTHTHTRKLIFGIEVTCVEI